MTHSSTTIRSIRERGFTLVEILVVVGIIAILIGIIFPVVSKAREASCRVACRANLADIGRLFQMYLNDSKGKLPQYINPVPSQTPVIIQGKSPTEVFEPYTKGEKRGWRCPADKITRHYNGGTDENTHQNLSNGINSAAETYFERDGLSYYYNPVLATQYAGQQVNDHPLYRKGKQNQLRIFNDFEPFHSKTITNGSCNYLFADMHVGDLANE